MTAPEYCGASRRSASVYSSVRTVAGRERGLTAVPGQDETCQRLVSGDMEGDLPDECAKERLAVPRRRAGGVPDVREIGRQFMKRS
ncbi:hypothetical protein [Rhizobium sp. YTU87027]|uniref:hypothetical protein n=1 Tax=Rhizobium sp. YTU87027 TaxID=3417741 RepID=UPI003D6963DA